MAAARTSTVCNLPRTFPRTFPVALTLRRHPGISCFSAARRGSVEGILLAFGPCVPECLGESRHARQTGLQYSAVPSDIGHSAARSTVTSAIIRH